MKPKTVLILNQQKSTETPIFMRKQIEAKPKEKDHQCHSQIAEDTMKRPIKKMV